MNCDKCCKCLGWLLLIVGVLYLLADFAVINMPLSWWAAAFLILGLKKVGMSMCKDCGKSKTPSKPKKAKKAKKKK